MAYTINDKVYTDHPMMDEIVYNCREILKQIVIKNDVLAANYEYDNSLSLAEAYLYGEDNDHFIPFAYFPYTLTFLTIFNNEILDPLGIRQSEGSLELWCENKRMIPYDIDGYKVRKLLEDFSNDWFYGRLVDSNIDFASYKFDSKFEEKNDYYRILMGLPPYEDPNLPSLDIMTHQYYIYLTNDEKGISYTKYFPADYTPITQYPDTTPLHLYALDDITVLQLNGSIDLIREDYPGYKYSYVNFLGDRALKLKDIRKAGKWDILYMPSVEPLVVSRFLDLYNSNKDIYANRYYDVAHSNHGYYYDQNMIVKLLAKVFADMVAETPEWYIRRDVLELRSVEYFLESYGVPFFKEIPLKYQKRIVRNLNKLIKFKSSTRNFEDILDIFELPETMIYKYFLFKKRDVDSDGTYSYSADADDGMFNFGRIERNDWTAYGDWDFGSSENYPEMALDTRAVDGGIYDLANEDLDPKIDPQSIIQNEYTDFDPSDDGAMFFLNLDTGEEHAVGDHDYGDPYMQDPSSVIPEDKNEDMLAYLRYWDEPRMVTVPIEAYDLEFVASEIHDSYDNYMRDSIYRTPYDDITYQDKYWDGDQDHNQVKDRIKELDFTIQGTKYMSIEYQLPSNDYFFQIEYFSNLLLSSSLNTNDIKIAVPSIATGREFRISDLFVFLSVLTDSYFRNSSDDNSTVIRRPDNISPENLFERFDITDENYDWKKLKLQEAYTEKSGRIFAFNPNLDKDALIEFISRRHSWHVFGRNTAENSYTNEEYEQEYLQKDLDRLGITDFIVPNMICSTVTELIDLYKNNKECYEKFKHEVYNHTLNEDQSRTVQYIYDQMYTAQFDSKFYTLSTGEPAVDMVDILKDRDYVLYNTYKTIALERNKESRQDMIRGIMNDTIETLQYYISGEGLEYIYSFCATESFNSLIQYIYLLILFFKSYKVHFIDPYVTYKINEKMLNGTILGEGSAMDKLNMLRLDILKKDKNLIRELIYIDTDHHIEDRSLIEEIHKDVVDIYTIFDADPEDDLDYDGKHPEEFSPTYKEANGGSSNRKLAVPYIMINGGLTRNKVYQWWNMNGATPGTGIIPDSLNIDGGNVEDFEFNYIRKDWFGTGGFNYIVDGGAPSHTKFISNSLKLTLKDTGELSADVRISENEVNVVSSDEGGLYIENVWESSSDFNQFSREYSEYFDEMTYRIQQIREDIQVVKDENALNRRINKCVQNTVGNILYVMDLVHSNGAALKEQSNEYAQEKSQELYDYFISNGQIFNWENIYN